MKEKMVRCTNCKKVFPEKEVDYLVQYGPVAPTDIAVCPLCLDEGLEILEENDENIYD
jgi:uncharacterized protein YbaR (Trm112 family)